MKRINNLLLTASITMMLISLIVPTLQICSAGFYPGPDISDSKTTGSLGEYVRSYVKGTYDAPSSYDHCWFTSERDPGSAEFTGYLWFWWTIDDNDPIEWYNAGYEESDDGDLDSGYFLQCETLSYFYYYGYEWPLSNYAYVFAGD